MEGHAKRPTFTLGEMIRKAREDMGWEQQGLADRLHCGRSTVAEWERTAVQPRQ